MRQVAAAVLACSVVVGQALADDEHKHGGAELVGKVSFANSCSPAVQDDFAQGVAMLHSFWWSAGEKAFRTVLEKDPSCAIAAWGIAAMLMNNPLAGIGASPAAAEKAQAAIEQGRTIGAKTERERDYIEAVAVYYRDFAARPERVRQADRATAFTALAVKYGDDDEAQIFSALYVAGTQAQSDQTYSAYARAVEILTPQLEKHPDHPGIAHYLIHSFDAPPIAAKGLPAALAYSKIAPAAPHAQHMPSHIFTRVGEWEASAAANTRAFAAALPGGELSEGQHASDYMVYAYLQLGRNAAAASAMQAAFAIPVPPPMSPGTFYARAAMPARLAMERSDWRAAAMLPLPPSDQPYAAHALTIFARAIGSARSGDAEVGVQETERLRLAHKTLTDAGNIYWATEVGIQATTASAWTEFARGDIQVALTTMRDAADREDRQEKHIVTPGRLLPARELLADMLMEAGQPVAALAEYEMSQTRDPNRFRGYFGAARAADAAGQQDRAAAYSRRLLDLAKDADTNRPELAWARSRS